MDNELARLLALIQPRMLEGDLADRVPEIRRVAPDNGLSEGELHTLNQFGFLLELIGFGQVLVGPAKRRLDMIMQDLCERVGVNWRLVKKRSRFQTALYYLFFRHMRVCVRPRFNTAEELVVKIPTFASRQEGELEELLVFANGVALLSEFLQPDSNKIIYMDVVSWLASGASKRWVPGGRQTSETTDRVHIFCQLTGVIPISKKPRSAFARKNAMISSSTRWNSILDPKSDDSDPDSLRLSRTSESESPDTTISISPQSIADAADIKHSDQVRASFGGQTTRKLTLGAEAAVASPAKRHHGLNSFSSESTTTPVSQAAAAT